MDGSTDKSSISMPLQVKASSDLQPRNQTKSFLKQVVLTQISYFNLPPLSYSYFSWPHWILKFWQLPIFGRNDLGYIADLSPKTVVKINSGINLNEKNGWMACLDTRERFVYTSLISRMCEFMPGAALKANVSNSFSSDILFVVLFVPMFALELKSNQFRPWVGPSDNGL